MEVSCKLRRRRHLLKPSEPGQWHTVPKTDKAEEGKIVTRRLAYKQSRRPI